MAGRAGRRSFGNIRRLPSGRWQATYRAPDGSRVGAPTTYTTKLDAEAWLLGERRLLESGEWRSPRQRQADLVAAERKAQRDNVEHYAATWLRRGTWASSTRALYADVFERLILPGLGPLPLADLTVAV